MQDDWYSQQTESYLAEKNGKNHFTMPSRLSRSNVVLVAPIPECRWGYIDLVQGNSVLNRSSTIREEAIARLPRVPVKEPLEYLPMKEEIVNTIKRLSSGNAPGVDSISAEVYASGGPKEHGDTARDFLFAGDRTFNACSHSDMQESIDLFARACDNLDLTIFTKKTISTSICYRLH